MINKKIILSVAILITGIFLSVSALASAGTKISTDASALNSRKGETTRMLTDGDEKAVRIGLADVKTGAVGSGVNAAQLAAAIQNALPQYMKGTKVEIVPLEAKLAAAIESEAKEKGCDFMLYATVSHKKGGGGFGMLKKIAPVLGSVVPVVGIVGVGGMIAGQAASTAINAAATSNVKAKDEVTLDIVLKNGESVALTKQFKAKAKSAGEDIISPLVEQAAQAIVDTVGK
jgi:hypothetical protein